MKMPKATQLKIRYIFPIGIAVILFIASMLSGVSVGNSIVNPEINQNSDKQTGVEPENNVSVVQKATLVNVVDGDTLTVKVNGAEQKVRLIGVDTPESVSSDESKNCEEGVMASAHTKEILVQKKELYLSKDKSETDQYGRLLRFVWLEQPTKQPNAEEIKNKMLNARLLKDGYAQAKDYEPDVTLSQLFHQLCDEATQKGLGVSYKWNES